MAEVSQKVEVLLKEYDQLKEEIRTALDVYGKMYAPLVSVAALISGLVTTINVPKEQQGLLYSMIPVLILGIFGVVWYGHEIALARLSARLEVVEYHISTFFGQPELLTWQSHWESIGRKGLTGGWQKFLVALAMLPGVAIYLVTAWQSDSWWVELTNDSIRDGVPFVIYVIVLLCAFAMHEFWYMRKLHTALKIEVKNHKQGLIDANVDHHSNPGTEPLLN